MLAQQYTRDPATRNFLKITLLGITTFRQAHLNIFWLFFLHKWKEYSPPLAKGPGLSFKVYKKNRMH